MRTTLPASPLTHLNVYSGTSLLRIFWQLLALGTLFAGLSAPAAWSAGPFDTRSNTPHLRAQKPQCRDGRDNDRDGRRDYPRDKGCKSRNDNNEKNRKRNPTPSPTATAIPGATATATPTGTSGPGGQLGVGVSLGGAVPFPPDNEWNRDISSDPVDPNSAALIASIGGTTGLHPDFGTVYEGAPIGIPYVVVNSAQQKVSVSFEYNDESDPGPYPIPRDAPIEGGESSSGDRHILVIDRDSWKLYELFSARFINGGWQAGSGAIFDLSSNALRPAGWTSADAAGLPIFPGLVRYDEAVENKKIEHALRFTVSRSRRAYVHPARHYASSRTDVNLPPMGMRVRLKAAVNISTYPEEVQVILRALKKYGMFVADNGSNWYITGAPDSRWSDDNLGTLRNIKGNDFEVVKMGTIVTE